MSYAGYLYAIALGTDVPLVNLLNVQQMFFPYNRVSLQEPPNAVAVVADPVDFAPVRIQALDSSEYRDGITYVSWRLTLNTLGVKFWLNYLFSAAVASRTGSISTPVTIYTRMAPFDDYTRQNAIAVYPTFGEDGDLQYAHKRGLFYLNQRFDDLTEPS